MKEFWIYFAKNVEKVISDLRSKDKEKIKKQIPNLLTIIRGFVAPITIIPAVITEHIYVAFIMIAICSITDSIDGWYARKFNAQSEFGAILDAICDKLFVVTLAFPLVFIHTKLITIILALEVLISIINSYSKLRGFEVYSSLTGKIKTIILDFSIAICYLGFIIKVPESILETLLFLTNLMQIASIFGYYRIYRSQLIEKNAEKKT